MFPATKSKPSGRKGGSTERCDRCRELKKRCDPIEGSPGCKLCDARKEICSGRKKLKRLPGGTSRRRLHVVNIDIPQDDFQERNRQVQHVGIEESMSPTAASSVPMSSGPTPQATMNMAGEQLDSVSPASQALWNTRYRAARRSWTSDKEKGDGPTTAFYELLENDLRKARLYKDLGMLNDAEVFSRRVKFGSRFFPKCFPLYIDSILLIADMFIQSHRFHQAESELKEFLEIDTASKAGFKSVWNSRLPDIYKRLATIHATEEMGFMGTCLSLEDLVTTPSTEWECLHSGSFLETIFTDTGDDKKMLNSLRALFEKAIQKGRIDIIRSCVNFFKARGGFEHLDILLPELVATNITNDSLYDSLKATFLEDNLELLWQTMIFMIERKSPVVDITRLLYSGSENLPLLQDYYAPCTSSFADIILAILYHDRPDLLAALLAYGLELENCQVDLHEIIFYNNAPARTKWLQSILKRLEMSTTSSAMKLVCKFRCGLNHFATMAELACLAGRVEILTVLLDRERTTGLPSLHLVLPRLFFLAIMGGNPEVFTKVVHHIHWKKADSPVPITEFSTTIDMLVETQTAPHHHHHHLPSSSSSPQQKQRRRKPKPTEEFTWVHSLTALHIAAITSNHTLLQHLLGLKSATFDSESQLSTTTTDSLGRTPLFYAIVFAKDGLERCQNIELLAHGSFYKSGSAVEYLVNPLLSEGDRDRLMERLREKSWLYSSIPLKLPERFMEELEWYVGTLTGDGRDGSVESRGEGNEDDDGDDDEMVDVEKEFPAAVKVLGPPRPDGEYDNSMVSGFLREQVRWDVDKCGYGHSVSGYKVFPTP